ncbi:FtsX-like permease family protein [Algoriphagus sp.]|uniref:ABC transporter permease n=1 Tax=Algoriphagus sp. TaxID=1872435 RepID=UPI003275C7C0
MKLAFQLAYRNLMGAGLRTILNSAVLSLSFVIIIFFNGIIDGWDNQARRESIKWEFGNGQVLHEEYDPQDPFTIQDAHGTYPDDPTLNPILLVQGSIYPKGRMMSIVLKGIKTDQEILAIPTNLLASTDAEIPVLIGKRMAEAAKLAVGDNLLLRWRDKNGTFDAQNITIAAIFDTDVGTVDNGQVWLDIEKLWAMTGLQSEATMLIASEDKPYDISGWNYRSQDNLLQELTDIITMKKSSGLILYGLLMTIALLAIFDTQVLSIFRRQKEIGTYIALGMTRLSVIRLFTVEGSMYSIFAMILGSLYGIPLLLYLSKTGIGMPAASMDMGVTLAERIYPIYGVGLILGTIVIIVLSATIVSFLPTRKISRLDPVDAIKGKVI